MSQLRLVSFGETGNFLAQLGFNFVGLALSLFACPFYTVSLSLQDFHLGRQILILLLQIGEASRCLFFLSPGVLLHSLSELIVVTFQMRYAFLPAPASSFLLDVLCPKQVILFLFESLFAFQFVCFQASLLQTYEVKLVFIEGLVFLQL